MTLLAIGVIIVLVVGVIGFICYELGRSGGVKSKLIEVNQHIKELMQSGGHLTYKFCEKTGKTTTVVADNETAKLLKGLLDQFNGTTK